MKKFLPISIVIASFIILFFCGMVYPRFLDHFRSREDFAIVSAFLSICLLLISAFISLYAAHETKLPAFVVAIILGIISKPLFAPIISDQNSLYIIISLGAALIVFGGGLETQFSNFKKIFWKLLVLSFPGVLMTAVLFTLSLFYVSALLGITLSITTAVLLGALLSSTDPAAIIPVLKGLKFKNNLVKDIVVSESAMNDVTGSLLTLVFIGIAVLTPNLTSIGDWYHKLFSIIGVAVLSKQIFFGISFGIFGFFALYGLKHMKTVYHKEFHADIVFFIFVPILIFSLCILFEGSGFLATFIAGLLFSISEHLDSSAEFYTNVTDGFFKPMIFVLLGALVQFGDLFNYAGIGLLLSFICIFILRPFMIFSCLGLFSFFGKERFSLNELLFISFVRETGAIPAVLLVIISTKGLVHIEGLVPIGMWVILSTLLFQPLLTRWVCKRLKIAD